MEKASGVDFKQQVWPILEQRCLSCHGPDKRKGGLRLDASSEVLAGGDSGPAFEAGKAEESLLIERIEDPDPLSRMPPSGEPLTSAQIQTLRDWINQGAAWPEDPAQPASSAAPGSDHWAFQSPVRPEPPEVKDNAWPRNPIDQFVLARLEAEGLSPSPEASRATLLRRLHLDLVGLPPTPEEVDAFLKDQSPNAYENAVDRLLKSPHYGERWARSWLDLARYADTNGYEKDRERSIWPYRDWVIRALNADQPFDQFTIEQIAGDLLPNATLDQKIATGFHRNTMINEEGGIDVEEFRYIATVDRVATTGTVWLGLTIACAQCHTHKYDPITQREYYQFLALLNNADEPEIAVPNPAIEARRHELDDQIALLEAELPSKFPLPADRLEGETDSAARDRNLRERQQAWEAGLDVTPWVSLAPTRLESLKNATMAVLPDRSVLVSGDKPNNDVYVVELTTDLENVSAIRLEALPHESLPRGGPGRAPLFSEGDFLLTEVELAAASVDSTEPPRRIALRNATEDYAAKDRPASKAIDGIPDTGWQVAGGIGQPHAAVFELAEPVGQGGSTRLTLTLHQEYIHQMTLGRFRLSVTTRTPPVRASGLPADIEEIVLKPVEQRSEAQVISLRRYFHSVAPELEEARKAIAELRASKPEFPTTMVMAERRPEHARRTQIHQRGEFLRPTDPVEPGVPAALPPLPSDAPADRLALARWLVSKENPLVARVTVNRLWQSYFGRGIVSTSEDFGTRGQPPSHPELLDWLAVEFQESGWSLKHMHRLIATSATYRQSSSVSPELLARDPQNHLLSRGPRLRVEAEVVRDLALSAAGLLNPEIGGPSVYPPQPEGVTALAYGQAAWPTSQGPDRYRRGLYTFIKRTAPYASFTTFDMPTSEVACPRRERTDTPLQALTLLNDPVFVEAAQALARRVIQEQPEGSTAHRVDRMFRLCLARVPDPEELDALTAFHDEQVARFQAGELKAQTVTGTDDPELAAWTAVARVLLNLDETITKE